MELSWKNCVSRQLTRKEMFPEGNTGALGTGGNEVNDRTICHCRREGERTLGAGSE